MIVNMANLRLNRKLKLSSCLVLIAIMMFDGFKFLIESRLDEWVGLLSLLSVRYAIVQKYKLKVL